MAGDSHEDGILLLLPDEVHQAAGMMSVQMSVHASTALRYLCWLAQVRRADVVDLAEQVVERSLRFDSAALHTWD